MSKLKKEVSKESVSIRCPVCGEELDDHRFCWKCQGYWGSPPEQVCEKHRRSLDIRGFCGECKDFVGLAYEIMHWKDQEGRSYVRSSERLGHFYLPQGKLELMPHEDGVKIMRLIRRVLNKRISRKEFLAEVDQLEKEYPGIGFKEGKEELEAYYKKWDKMPDPSRPQSRFPELSNHDEDEEVPF